MFLIPKAWRDFVVPAYEFTKSHPDQLTTAIGVPNAEQQEGLQHLLDDPNPIIALAAYRALVGPVSLQTGQPSGLFDAPLGRSRGYLRAGFVYLLLNRFRQAARAPNTQAVSKLIAASEDVAQLKFVALGIMAEAAREAVSIDSGPEMHKLLQEVREKQMALHASGPDNDAITKMVRE